MSDMADKFPMTVPPRFTTIRYGRPVSLAGGEAYDVCPGYAHLPVLSLKVRGVVYFADKYGYLMMWTGRMGYDPIAEKMVKVAENVAWADDARFVGPVPNEVVTTNLHIAVALSVLYGLDLDAVYSAYDPNQPDAHL